MRELGLTELRYVPKKSDPELQELVPAAWNVPEMTAPRPNGLDAPWLGMTTVVDPEAQRRRELLEAQNRALAGCNQRFSESTRQYQSMERTCRVPCDYRPRRSWPLFKARAVLRGLRASNDLQSTS